MSLSYYPYIPIVLLLILSIHFADDSSVFLLWIFNPVSIHLQVPCKFFPAISSLTIEIIFDFRVKKKATISKDLSRVTVENGNMSSSIVVQQQHSMSVLCET